MLRIAPTASDRAPTNMCDVAISAALFDQMVAAPRHTCTNIMIAHAIDSLAMNLVAPRRRAALTAAAATTTRIATATIRWTICRTTWDAVIGLAAITSTRWLL